MSFDRLNRQGPDRGPDRGQRQVREAAGCVVEALEERKLLAAVLNGSILDVTGTTRADKIYFSYSSDATKYVIQIGKNKQQFTRRGIRALRINGGGGSDTINLTQSTGKLRVSLYGGSGNDAIFGHNGKEGVDGGTGNDTITGAGGSDNLSGGDGDDFVIGSTGHDRLMGNGGHDLMFGDAGNDTVSGHEGNDTLGGDDEDVLSFTSPIDNEDAIGNDRVDGGDGDDVLLSGVQSNSIPDSSGQDTFTGGAGADVIDARGANDSITDFSAAEDYRPASDYTPVTHASPATHEHANLRVFVRVKGGYAQVVIPMEIGIFDQMSTLHTHDFSGRIHFESTSPSATYRLKDFFTTWGITFNSRHLGRYVGKTITMKVAHGQGAPFANNTEFENYQPQNEERIDIFIG